MQRVSTFILKAAIVIIAIPVVVLGVYGLPQFVKEAAEVPIPAGWVYPAIGGMYAAGIPFFCALHRAFLLLVHIDRKEAFSEASVRAIRQIQFCAFAICILYASISPFLYLMAQRLDAPGILAIGLTVIFASFIIAVFAAVLQTLLRQAIEIKMENDLTV
jgi:hypothetical protein